MEAALSDYNMRLIIVSVIQLSGGHCIHASTNVHGLGIRGLCIRSFDYPRIVKWSKTADNKGKTFLKS